jgi:classical protein kinase C
MSQLLTRDPARRIGSGKEDAEEIKRQPFFKDVSFDDVMNKRIPPPYFPKIVSRKNVFYASSQQSPILERKR